jgi:hypothetical protein
MLSLAVATFLLGAIVLADRMAFAVVGVVVALNGAALAFFGLVQQLTWNGQLFWSIPLTRGGAPFASYVNRNNAAGFLNMCLACAVGLTVWGLVHNSYAAWRRGIVRPDSEATDSSNHCQGLILRVAAVTLSGDAPAAAGPPELRHRALGLTAAGCIAAGVFSSLSRGGMVGWPQHRPSPGGRGVGRTLAAQLAGAGASADRARSPADRLCWSKRQRDPACIDRVGRPRCGERTGVGRFGRMVGWQPRTCCRWAADWELTGTSTVCTSSSRPMPGSITPRTSICRRWSKPGCRVRRCC